VLNQFSKKGRCLYRYFQEAGDCNSERGRRRAVSARQPPRDLTNKRLALLVHRSVSDFVSAFGGQETQQPYHSHDARAPRAYIVITMIQDAPFRCAAYVNHLFTT
jgi:hypothetical protein